MNFMDFLTLQILLYKIGLMLGKTPPPLDFVGVCIVIGIGTSCFFHPMVNLVEYH